MTKDEKAAAVRITPDLVNSSAKTTEQKAADILYALVCRMDAVRSATYAAGIGFDMDWSEFKNSLEFVRSEEFANWRQSVRRKRAKKVATPSATTVNERAA